MRRTRTFGLGLILLGGAVAVLMAAGAGSGSGGDVAALPAADGSGVSLPVPVPADPPGSGVSAAFGPDDEGDRVVILEVEKVPVRCPESCGYDFELQWVIIQNRSHETVNLEGWNLSTDNGVMLAPDGLELIEAPGDYGYNFPPGMKAIIVTSPVVLMDRGAPVSYRWVFTAIDPDFEHYVHDHDIQQVSLYGRDVVEDEGRLAVVDVHNPECIGGCCCEGHDPPFCWTDFWDKVCESECGDGTPDNCGGAECACWLAGNCGPPIANCCNFGGGCTNGA